MQKENNVALVREKILSMDMLITLNPKIESNICGI